MSDPVTNVEVEDVLSSIRRLVSDDKRPTASVQSTPSSDRLVLTPALRVAEDDELSDDVSQASDSSETHAWSDFGSVPHEEDVQDNDVQDDIVQANAELEVDDVMHEESDPVMASLEAEILALDTDENDSLDVQDSVGDLSSIEAGTNPFVLDTLQDVEPADAELETAVLDDVAEGDDAAVVPQNDIPDAEFVEEQSEAAFFASGAASLSAKIAALEMVIGKTDEQWEPDDTGGSDYSGTEAPSMSWEDTNTDEDDAELETVAPVEEKPDVEQPAGFSESVDSILDEEALRDIVSDIVREELQGALGERITRNVRKLVRREIHRALAAQEFE